MATFHEIVLDEHFMIKPDGNNFTLIYRKVNDDINPKTGKPSVTENQWYPPTLKAALKSYLRESLRESKDIQDVLKRIDEVEQNINNLKFK